MRCDRPRVLYGATRPRDVPAAGRGPDLPKAAPRGRTGGSGPLLADGFDLVGCGIARCVLRFPATSSLSEFVVKLGRFGVGPVPFGAVQNKPEALVWTRHGEGGDWPLVPVADYEQDRFSLLVMPYGEPITDRPEAKQQELLRQVRSRIRFLDSFDMRELFKSNIVVVDGTPLVADYGLPDGL